MPVCPKNIKILLKEKKTKQKELEIKEYLEALKKKYKITLEPLTKYNKLRCQAITEEGHQCSRIAVEYFYNSYQECCLFCCQHTVIYYLKPHITRERIQNILLSIMLYPLDDVAKETLKIDKLSFLKN